MADADFIPEDPVGLEQGRLEGKVHKFPILLCLSLCDLKLRYHFRHISDHDRRG